MRNGGQGVIETGKLRGLKFLIPAEVLVENGNFNGIPKYQLACLIHEEYLPNSGCDKCRKELEALEHSQPKQQEVAV